MKFYTNICLAFFFLNIGAQTTDLSVNKQHGIFSKKDSINHLIKSGDSLTLLQKNVEAKKAYNKAFRLSIEVDDHALIIKSGFKLEQFLFMFIDNDQESLATSSFLYDYCSRVKDTICIARANFRLGINFKKQLDYIKALSHYNTVLELAQKINNIELAWRAHTSIGNLYLDIDDWELARKEYKKLPHLLPGHNPDYYRTMSYINISSTFNNPDSILHYSEIAIQNCKRKPSKRECDLAYNNMAWSYVLKNEPKKALEIITQNIDLTAIEYATTDTLYNALMHTLGSIYFQLGNYKKAIEYFNLTLQYSQKENNIAIIIRLKEDIARSYEKIGDLQSSIRAYKEIKSLTAEFDNLKLKKELAKIESKKLIAIKEEQIFDLELENQEIGVAMNTTRIFNYLLALFLVITLTGLLYYKYKSKIKFHQVNEELSLNRIKSLRSMMNPHFLFNSFSTLQNYILKKENLKANEYMTELSGLIRKVFMTSDSIYISFTKEIELLVSYINLEKERFDNAFEIQYEIDEKLIRTNPIIPSMIIQPYIENAIIHGFSYSKKKHLLKLSFKKQETMIECKIIDDGIGRKKAEMIKKNATDEAHLSIATRNTNDRLRILSKIGKNPTSIVINDLYSISGEATGTEVIIILPIQKEIKHNERTS